MSLVFEDFEDFERWRQQNSVEITEEQVAEIKEQLGSNDSENGAPEEKRKLNPILIFVAIIVLIFGVIRTTCGIIRAVFL